MSNQPLMMTSSRCGFFGKVPSLGDFVSRGLDAGIIQALDLWLIRLLSDVEKAHPSYMECWHGFPILRFAFSPYVISPKACAGVIATSNDSVGRSFPLIILYELVSDQEMEVLSDINQTWFSDIEDIIFVCRNQMPEPDRLYQIICRTYPSRDELSEITMALEENAVNLVCTGLKNFDEPKSRWWTALGSNLLMECDGLPELKDLVLFVGNTRKNQGVS